MPHQSERSGDISSVVKEAISFFATRHFGRAVIGLILLRLGFHRLIWDIAAVLDDRRYVIGIYRSVSELSFQGDVEFVYEQLARQQAQSLAPFIGKDSTVLDFGIGSGRIEPWLPRCKRLMGVDISPLMIRKAKRRLSSYSHIKLCVLTRESGLPENTFDFVFSIGVLHHIPKARAMEAVRNLVASLKPGGRFYLTLSAHPRDSPFPITYEPYTPDEAKVLLPESAMLDTLSEKPQITLIGYKQIPTG